MKNVQESIALLKQLISIPSISGKEQGTADCIQAFFKSNGIETIRKYNNVWALSTNWDNALPTILLNSHHDTVKPSGSYTHDPFNAIERDGKLYGLGSNDAGGALVSLLAVFMYFYSIKDRSWNLIYAATAEEEISGKKGIECILKDLGPIDLAIVGEPTSMEMAIAEKGLLVLDCEYHGVSGHAAREEGENAIYKALKDLEWFQSFKFNKVSELLGPVKMSVTQIEAGTGHNVVPDICRFVVDVRCTDAYSLEETLGIIEKHTDGRIIPRSRRLNPSGISENHPIVEAAKRLDIPLYGSPTLSDQSLMPFNSVKIGPGDSKRSHTADEFIYLAQIEKGISTYIKLLEGMQGLAKSKTKKT